MSKGSRKKTTEPAETVLDGALKGTVAVVDDEALPQVNDEVIPDITSDDWTPFIMTKFKPDELHDGCPDYNGLRRIVTEYLGDIIDTDPDIRQTPNANNGNHSCVVMKITIDHPPEFYWLGRLAGRTVRYGHVGDVFSGNGDKSQDVFAWQYSSATCTTRTKASLLRDALRLKKVYAREEISAISPEESGVNGSMICSQARCLDMMCSRLKVNAAKFLTGVWRHLSKDKVSDDLNDVPYVIAQKALGIIQPWQHNRDKIDPKVVGYDPTWTKDLECLK